MAEEVKLFGVWASPISRRVEIALKMKGVKYEYIEEDLNNKSPLLLKYNPVHKKIPVLVHNGKPIAECLVIIEYIDETWKHNPILPQHPYDRALARFWAKFIDEKWTVLRNSTLGKGKEREVARGEACEHLKTLENELGDKKFFGGEDIGLVDIVANVLGTWFGVFQELSGLEYLLTEEKFPKLCKWIHEYANHTAIKEDIPPSDKLIEYYSARLRAASK